MSYFGATELFVVTFRCYLRQFTWQLVKRKKQAKNEGTKVKLIRMILFETHNGVVR